jgi:hypothetical protein
MASLAEDTTITNESAVHDSSPAADGPVTQEPSNVPDVCSVDNPVISSLPKGETYEERSGALDRPPEDDYRQRH